MAAALRKFAMQADPRILDEAYNIAVKEGARLRTGTFMQQIEPCLSNGASPV